MACAASSTELSGTSSSSASRCDAATRSEGIAASCTAMPAIGSRVHRGITVDPPAASTPRQKSRPASARTASADECMATPLTLKCFRGRLSIGNLMGRVSAPPRASRDLLALHQEAVGGELGSVADRHAVVDVGARAEGDVGSEGGVVRLEGAVLLRVALDRCWPR